MRGLAILLVLWVHFAQLFIEKSNTKLWKLALFGQTGVDLFFVLSGFLITGILLDTKGTEHVVRNFYVRRLLRIVPLYYLALIALYFIAPAAHLIGWTPWQQQLWYWTYMQDIPWAFDSTHQTGPNHFWSLAVEQHYYLLWPFLVLRFNNDKLLKIILGAVAISLLSRVIWSHYEMYYFTLARLDSLSLGAALAIFARTTGLLKLVPWAFRALAFVVVLGVIGALLPPAFLPVTRVFRNTLIAVFYASGIVLLLENQCAPVSKLLSTAVFRSIGRYSYAMYIFHPFIFAWLLARGFMHYNLWSLLLGGLVTYAAGAVSWQVLEKPILTLKRYFEYDEKRKSRIEPSPIRLSA